MKKGFLGGGHLCGVLGIDGSWLPQVDELKKLFSAGGDGGSIIGRKLYGLDGLAGEPVHGLVLGGPLGTLLPSDLNRFPPCLQARAVCV